MRIISLLPSATEMLFGLGLGDLVVAVSHECDEPAQVCQLPRVTRSNLDSKASSRAIDSTVRDRLASGDALYSLDRAAIEALQPDWIVTQAQCDVCAVRFADVLHLVSEAPALRNTRVTALNPQSLGDVFRDLQTLAELGGVAEAGQSWLASLTSRVDRVRQLVVGRQRPRVACIEWTEPLMFAGNWIPELIERAGGQCRLAKAGEHSPYGEWSALVGDDPEVLIISPCGFDLERTWQEVPALAERPDWTAISAVRQGRVVVVDGNAQFNRPGPRLVETLEILGHLLHPEAVPRPEVSSARETWRFWPDA